MPNPKLTDEGKRKLEKYMSDHYEDFTVGVKPTEKLLNGCP